MDPALVTMDSEESFAALVNTANPAAHPYGYHSRLSSNSPYPTYPPSSNMQSRAQDAPHLMDPFFDDDDDLLDLTPTVTQQGAISPHTSSAHPIPMQSQESGLPLTHSAAPPAGLDSSLSLSTPGTHPSQGWNFESETAFTGSASFPGTPHSPRTPMRKRKKWKWKWPWEKEAGPTGERVITLNNPEMNNQFCSNFVSTSKYNVVTFVPKFFKGSYGREVRLRMLKFTYRTILQVCELVLLVHCMYTANTWRIPHEQVYHHCSSGRCSTCLSSQRNARGFGLSARQDVQIIVSIIAVTHRNVTIQTLSSMHALQKS